MRQVHDKTGLPNTFKDGDQWVTDIKSNTEKMNQYYAKVGVNTNQSVGETVKDATHFLSKYCQVNPESLDIGKFKEEDVLTACSKINKKKSCDAFGLSQGVVIRDADVLASQIAHVANCSIESGTVPDMTKIARVLPIYKEK